MNGCVPARAAIAAPQAAFLDQLPVILSAGVAAQTLQSRCKTWHCVTSAPTLGAVS